MGQVNTTQGPDLAISEAVHAEDPFDIRLYKGRMFTPESYLESNHPFFLSNRWIDGTIILDGTRFPGVFIQHDIAMGRVALNLPLGNRSVFIHPHSSRINGMILDGHRFIHLQNGAGDPLSCDEGYYELIYDNRVSLLVKHQKALRVNAAGPDQYEYSRLRYIYMDGKCLPVRNKRDLLAALSQREEEIRRYIKEQGIFIRGAEDREIAGILQYYMNIKPE